MADSIEEGSPVGWTVPVMTEGQLRWNYELPPLPATDATGGRDAQLP